MILMTSSKKSVMKREIALTGKLEDDNFIDNKHKSYEYTSDFFTIKAATQFCRPQHLARKELTKVKNQRRGQ